MGTEFICYGRGKSDSFCAHGNIQ